MKTVADSSALFFHRLKLKEFAKQYQAIQVDLREYRESVSNWLSGGFNECYVHIILQASHLASRPLLQVAVKLFDPTHGRQAAVAGLACIGVVLGMCVVRDIPRQGPRDPKGLRVSRDAKAAALEAADVIRCHPQNDSVGATKNY